MDKTIENFRDGMALVEGGTYFQGSVEAPYATTERAHRTTLSSFRISSTETTQALWFSVMGTNPSKFRGDDKPVDTVSWMDAVRFCNALSAKEGLQDAYAIDGSKVSWLKDSNGYRLPTEAEWEYAARGGRSGAPADAPAKKAGYSGGMEAGEVAWYEDNSKKASHPAAQKKGNALGLFDMSGNVWEWCWDWYGEYSKDPVVDPEGVGAGAGVRVMRGGAWFTPANLTRTTYRYWNAPTFKVNSVGFRVARNVAPYGLETKTDLDFFSALAAPAP